MVYSPLPPALTALERYPLLYASVETSLARQTALIHQRAGKYCRALLEEVDVALQRISKGMIALIGPPGSGITTVLAHLAATRPYAYWFGDDDNAQGSLALCVQLIGLHRPTLPLPFPAAATDHRALEQFLALIATQYVANQPETEHIPPLVLVIDAPTHRVQPLNQFPFALPTIIPDHVVILYGTTPDAPLPYEPTIRIALPLTGEKVRQEQTLVLQEAGCPTEWYELLLAVSEGNYLFLTLAPPFIMQGIVPLEALQHLRVQQERGEQGSSAGITAALALIYAHWWQRLDATAQCLALMLAAAGEALPLSLCFELLEVDPTPILNEWATLGIAAADPDHIAWHFTHWSIADYLARHYPTLLAPMHREIAEYILEETSQAASPVAPLVTGSTPDPTAAHLSYLHRNFTRHAALGDDYTRHTLLPRVAQRTWIRSQERRSGHVMWAAQDLLWELAVATSPEADREHQEAPKEPEPTPARDLGSRLLRIGRDMVLAGTLLTLSRVLPADVAQEAFLAGLETFGKEGCLRRVLEVVNQLPDGWAKAQVLRKLGEACYEAKMRASAMRLLSQALDMEEQRLPASWLEQRDQLLIALVRSALEHQAIEAALAISEHIAHLEKRGMAETEVVRCLLKRGELLQARRVAGAIHHENLGSWAMAEVAVTHHQVGETYTAEMLLADIRTETARAWAEIEFACALVATDPASAVLRIERMANPQQRDHGFARLSEAFALAGKAAQALNVAQRVEAPTLRASALLKLRSIPEITIAITALEQANSAIAQIQDDARIPFVTMLASAYASLGYREEALRAAQQLSSEEEQTRAQSRVAVALTQAGYVREGLEIARGLADADERDWTLNELARVFSESGSWQEAQALALEIKDERDRDRSLANVAISLSRTGAPLPALWLSRKIATPTERARVLHTIAPVLVEAGYLTEAMEAITRWEKKAKTPLAPEAVSRYLAAMAISLAEHHQPDQAQTLIPMMLVSFDRARSLLAIARATIDQEPARSFAALGQAVRLATVDRSSAFRLLEHIVPLIAAAGGATALVHLANEVKTMDAWW